MNTVPHSVPASNPLYTIYALIDPRTNAVRYVGVTDNVYRRFYQHIACQGKNPTKDSWINELKSRNIMVIMQTLENVETLPLARKREQYWIAHYAYLGAPLVNNEHLPDGKRSKAGRKRQTRLQRAINWVLWERTGFDPQKSPWLNPSEYKKHPPMAEEIAEARQLLGIEKEKALC